MLFNAFKRFSKSYSNPERAALFYDTAARAYRMTNPDRKQAMPDYRYDHVHLRSPRDISPVQFGFGSARAALCLGSFHDSAHFYREERGASGTYEYDGALRSRHSQYVTLLLSAHGLPGGRVVPFRRPVIVSGGFCFTPMISSTLQI